MTGSITSGFYTTGDNGPGITFYATIQNVVYVVESACTTLDDNPISISATGSSNGVVFSGAVECSPSQGGGDTAAQPTSSPSSATGTTTAQDSDGDGIPDSSDKCANNSNHRCFKERYINTATAEQPSSNGSRNQTR